MSCGSHRAELCPARCRLVGWAAPRGTAHVVYRGYPGSYPPHISFVNLSAPHLEESSEATGVEPRSLAGSDLYQGRKDPRFDLGQTPR